MVVLGFAVEAGYAPALYFVAFIASHVVLLGLAWAIRRALAYGAIYTGRMTILRSENPVIFWATFIVLLVSSVMVLAFAVGTDWILWLMWNDR